MAISGLRTWADAETITASALNADKAILEAKFGAITNADLSATAAIENSKLANDDYEIIVSLKLQPTTAVAPTVSATVPFDVVGLPGGTSDGISYTPISATASLQDSGDVNDTVVFKVEWGSFTGAGNTWAQVGAADVISATTLTSVTANANVQSKPTVDTTALVLDATVPRFLALFVTTIDANAMADAYSYLKVDIKLKRTDGLRS